MFIVSFLSLFTLSVLARDVVFPPLAAVHTSQQYFLPFKDDPAILLAGADFHGLSTYANLPYVKCMSSEEEVEKYDIAILGAPFDTVSFFVLIHVHNTEKVREGVFLARNVLLCLCRTD
jgi:agmatinase